MMCAGSVAFKKSWPRAPEDPRRAFVEAVEASRDSVALADLARAFSTLTERLAAQEETLARVRRLLEQDRAQITLNVRAPKRARDPPIAGDISGAGGPVSPCQRHCQACAPHACLDGGH